MTSTGSSLPSSSDANRHAHTFQAFVEIIFSGDDQAHSMPSYKPGMAMAINPVGGPTKPISIPAAAAHEILRRGVHGRALSALGDYLGVEVVIGQGQPENEVVQAFLEVMNQMDFTLRQTVTGALMNILSPGNKQLSALQSDLQDRISKTLEGVSPTSWPASVLEYAEAGLEG